MNQSRQSWLKGARAFTLCCLAALTPLLPAHANDAAPTNPARVDFDDRIVKGQRHAPGTVYIFERQKVELQSMVLKPRSFRHRIIRTVFEE